MVRAQCSPPSAAELMAQAHRDGCQPPQGLVKVQVAGPTPASHSAGLVGAQELAFLTGSQVMWMLQLVQGPHFGNLRGCPALPVSGGGNCHLKFRKCLPTPAPKGWGLPGSYVMSMDSWVESWAP